MNIVSQSHQIKKRQKAKDVFITPKALAKHHILITNSVIKEQLKKSKNNWYDPFKNSGNYYNQYPKGVNKKWAEILKGRDFFEFSEANNANIVCSNHPYSITDEVLNHLISTFKKYPTQNAFFPNLHCISLLMSVEAITPRRMEYMEKAGWELVYIEKMKVYKWYGMSSIVIWLKKKFCNSLKKQIKYNRTVWK